MICHRVATPIAFGVFSLIAASAAQAQEGAGVFWPPKVEGELVIEVENDNTVESDDDTAEFNNLNSTTELGLNAYFAEPLFVNVHFTLEQTQDPKPDTTCTFCRHGVFVEGLSLNWEEERWSVIGGKFGPNFAIAWDAAPGIYGTGFGEDDIELAERIGLGGGVTLLADDTAGTHTLSASVFFADTTALSESFGTNRGLTETDDGGPSNTESLESFAVALDGAWVLGTAALLLIAPQVLSAPGRWAAGAVAMVVAGLVDGNGNLRWWRRTPNRIQ